MIRIVRILVLISMVGFVSCREFLKGNDDNSSISKELPANLVLIDSIDELEPVAEFEFADTSFAIFYSKFTNDTIFQLDRIKFPLAGQYESYDTVRQWTAENWPMMEWDLRFITNEPGDSIAIVQQTNQFFYGVYCLDCGFSFEMQFDKVDGDWFLTYRQENNY